MASPGPRWAAVEFLGDWSRKSHPELAETMKSPRGGAWVKEALGVGFIWGGLGVEGDA